MQGAPPIGSRRRARNPSVERREALERDNEPHISSRRRSRDTASDQRGVTERELQRERERQREKEMRELRDFSLKLPQKLPQSVGEPKPVNKIDYLEQIQHNQQQNTLQHQASQPPLGSGRYPPLGSIVGASTHGPADEQQFAEFEAGQHYLPQIPRTPAAIVPDGGSEAPRLELSVPHELRRLALDAPVVLDLPDGSSGGGAGGAGSGTGIATELSGVHYSNEGGDGDFFFLNSPYFVPEVPPFRSSGAGDLG